MKYFEKLMRRSTAGNTLAWARSELMKIDTPAELAAYCVMGSEKSPLGGEMDAIMVRHPFFPPRASTQPEREKNSFILSWRYGGYPSSAGITSIMPPTSRRASAQRLMESTISSTLFPVSRKYPAIVAPA